MTVLFIDDDVDDREFFIDALSYVDSSIKCIVGKDCDDAFRILDELPQLPDYIFLDINMPSQEDGKKCLALLKESERFSSVRIVMYSNTNDQSLMEDYKRLGATYFLVKPPTFKGLCDSLSVLFDK